MSNLAYAAPQRPARPEAPRPLAPQPRHIEVAPTRSQRRSRPKVFYALVTVGALFALFMAQLLLSIVLADGAYQISGLRVEQRDLARQEQSLGEELDLLKSPQNLAKTAESLGMVISSDTPMFLRLSDGKVLGSAGAAGDGSKLVDGKSFVPNALLKGLATAGTASAGTAAASDATEQEPDSGAPAIEKPASNVASTPGTLPSPVTR